MYQYLYNIFLTKQELDKKDINNHNDNILLQLNGNNIYDMEHPPEYATKNSCGLDIKTPEKFILEKGKMKKVNTNLKLNIKNKILKDNNFCFLLKSKSGLCLKYGINVLAGVIDKDYENEICVLLQNTGDKDVLFNKGDKICQMLTVTYYNILPPNKNKINGGFGSTGL